MYSFQTIIFWFCITTFVVVFGMLIYALITQQKSREKIAREIFWAVIPFVILLVLAIPAAKVFLH